ncbi:Type 1 glutamine amidotransferase-like domain-containing protein [Shewanella woodyi]|uniref:Type 1 glutamine amidotransferase-like domain-containing protein n=1 Tax=Shewanella woodyi TaxID=60961 RepID=UPI0037497C77
MKLALLSSPTSSNGIDAIKQILAVQKKKVCKLAYIASGPEPDRQYFRQTQALYEELGAQMSLFVELESEFDDDILPELFGCDVIHLAGGDTFRFLKGLKRRGLLPKLRQYLEAGGALVGVSAGAMIMTPSIESAFLCGDSNDVELKDLSALELVPFHFMPHLPSELSTPVDFIAELQCKDVEFDEALFESLYLCQDNSALVLIDGELEELGSPLLWTSCVEC